MPEPVEHSPARRATRREFIKTSATGAAALAGLSVASSVHSSAHVRGTDVIRVGMIGCGDRCSGAAAQILGVGPYLKLVAMCDVFEDRLTFSKGLIEEARPGQIDVPVDRQFTGFDGYEHVIESCDVVLIACASKFHPMYAEAAVRAGKHVFVEKPHGIDPVSVRRMIAVCELAREKGVSIVSGLQSRYSRGWQETVGKIHEGAIGDIVSMQSMFLRGPYRTYARDPGLTETQYQFRNWYHFRWLSGDDVTQSLVHNVDRMSWIMRGEMPTWCFGLGGRSSSFGEVYGDMFDHHSAVYEYESGARLHALCRTQVGCYNNAGDIIMGTKGTCHLHKYRIQGETNWKFEGEHNNPYEEELRALVESIRSGVPVNSGDYMNKSTMMAVLGQVACYTGKPTSWDEVSGSNISFGPSPDESSFETKAPSVMDDTGNYPLPLPGITEFKS